MKKAYNLFIVFVCVLLLSSIESNCQSFNYTENSVYIYNFIKYTEWPGNKINIQIGVVGNSPVENELKTLLAKKKKNGIVTYSVKKINVDESKNMDVIIISKSASNELKAINKMTFNLPILIITEKENMNRNGACISFFIDEDHDYKTSYQLSARNCKSRRLALSEQIINNAELIR